MIHDANSDRSASQAPGKRSLRMNETLTRGPGRAVEVGLRRPGRERERKVEPKKEREGKKRISPEENIYIYMYIYRRR